MSMLEDIINSLFGKSVKRSSVPRKEKSFKRFLRYFCLALAGFSLYGDCMTEETPPL